MHKWGTECGTELHRSSASPAKAGFRGHWTTVLPALTLTHSGPATTSSVRRAPPTASRTMGSWNGVAQSFLRPVGVEPSILRSGCAWLGGDEAGRAAFDIVLTERPNTTHPDTDPSRCAWCGKSETPDGTLTADGRRRPSCMAAPGPLGAMARGPAQGRHRDAGWYRGSAL